MRKRWLALLLAAAAVLSLLGVSALAAGSTRAHSNASAHTADRICFLRRAMPPPPPIGWVHYSMDLPPGKAAPCTCAQARDASGAAE